jgi:hypothetical protein
MDADIQLNSVITSSKGRLVSLWMSVVITKENNVMVNSEELIGNYI